VQSDQPLVAQTACCQEAQKTSAQADAIEPVDLSGIILLFVAPEARAAAAAGEELVVIGETMVRVRAVASELGAQVFERPAAATTMRETWEANSSWLRSAMRDNKTIIDIGVDPARDTRSLFYRAEKALIQQRGYTNVVSPGEL
jgi:hypothetical protein